MVAAVGLGIWQVRRDGERNAGREAALTVVGLPPLGEADGAEGNAWRTVRWTGYFAGEIELIGGRDVGGQRGYDVVQPFMRTSGGRVWVDRGWVDAGEVDAVVAGAHAARGGVPSSGDGAIVLTGQLRPAAGSADAEPISGHGTRIWPPGSWPALGLLAGVPFSTYVLAGGEGGVRAARNPLVDGYEMVPERDNTSAHYALQWFGIAVLGFMLLVPSAMTRARDFLGA